MSCHGVCLTPSQARLALGNATFAAKDLPLCSRTEPSFIDSLRRAFLRGANTCLQPRWMELTPSQCCPQALSVSFPFETNRLQGEERRLFYGTSFRAVWAKTAGMRKEEKVGRASSKLSPWSACLISMKSLSAMHVRLISWNIEVLILLKGVANR